MAGARRRAQPGARGAAAPSDDSAERAPRWQRRGNTAQWISAMAALLALLFFTEQALTFTRNAREASARQIYISYMDSGYKSPEFIAPDYDAIKADKKRLALYRWFVMHMLWAYDEAIDAMREDLVMRLFRYGVKNKHPEDAWINSFRYDLRPHLRFLCEYADAEVFSQLEKGTVRVMLDAMEHSDEPECRQRFKKP